MNSSIGLIIFITGLAAVMLVGLILCAFLGSDTDGHIEIVDYRKDTEVNDLSAKNEIVAKSRWSIDKNFESSVTSHDSNWNKLRQRVFIRDDYRCVLCQNDKNLSVDHIKELRIGGTNSLKNLRTLCKQCHEERHLRKFMEYGYDANDNYGENYKLSRKIAFIDKSIKNKTPLSIVYKDMYGVRSCRIIHPDKLAIRNKKIYLKAYCDLAKENRIFMISRMNLSKKNKNEYVDIPTEHGDYEGIYLDI